MELLLDVLLISVNSQIKLYFKNANAHFSHLCVLVSTPFLLISTPSIHAHPTVCRRHDSRARKLRLSCFSVLEKDTKQQQQMRNWCLLLNLS